MNIEEQIKIIKQNVVHLETDVELKERLSKKPQLKIKWGIDPTAPDIHLGHLVIINKLNDFLKLGHEVVIIVGDFTAMVGDPTGRSKTRPQLSKSDVDKNAQTYINQLKKVLVPGKLTIRTNSEWISDLQMMDLVKLLSNFTVARMLERDDFSNRFKNNEPIHLHEFFYVFLQAYDSTVLQPDIELGGTEQLFNLNAGRWLMKDLGQQPQMCITLPILTGTDGKQRMSKSLGNYIGVSEEPFEVFSKVMSIPDEIIDTYYKLVLSVKPDELNSVKAKFTNPRDLKLDLGFRITEKLNNLDYANSAKEKWIKVFSKKEVTELTGEISLNRSELKENSKIWIVDLVYKAGIFSSKSDVRRVIEQGGVEINQSRVTNTKAEIEIDNNTIIKIGKKNQLFKVKLTETKNNV